MPWAALPFAETKRNYALIKNFDVATTPSLLIFEGSTGKMLDADGSNTVLATTDDIEEALWKWHVEEDLCLK